MASKRDLRAPDAPSTGPPPDRDRGDRTRSGDTRALGRSECAPAVPNLGGTCTAPRGMQRPTAPTTGGPPVSQSVASHFLRELRSPLLPLWRRAAGIALPFEHRPCFFEMAHGLTDALSRDGQAENPNWRPPSNRPIRRRRRSAALNPLRRKRLTWEIPTCPILTDLYRSVLHLPRSVNQFLTAVAKIREGWAGCPRWEAATLIGHSCVQSQKPQVGILLT